jgi:phosphatidylinositol glycan class Z
VIGIFTRVTFVAFVLPIGWQLFHLMSAKSDRTGRSLWYTQAHRLLPPTLTTCLATLAVILVDTYYFRGDFSTLVITPLNFVLYNLSPKNLAEHGIHPRWLHLLVNLPIMVGPPLLWLAVLASLQHWRIPAEKQADTNHIVDQSK